MKRRDFAKGIATASTFMGLGCRPLPPIETIEYPAPNDPDTKQLVVMLPGLGDAPEAYDDHGFVGLLPRARVDADVIAVSAHLSHYVDRTLLPKLRDGVIEPARAHGYTSIWVLGISMGGLGAALAAREFEADVDGMVLLSPFLGARKTVRSIEAAGGLKSWTPPPEPTDDYTVELWRWLKGYAEAPGARPSLFVGHGSKETKGGYALLAGALPSNRVAVAEGGHGWKAWEKLLPELISRGAFAA